MPDGQNFDFGFPVPPTPPAPPTVLWPRSNWPEVIVDQYRVMLADPDGNMIGMPAPIPLARTLQTNRNDIRSF